LRNTVTGKNSRTSLARNSTAFDPELEEKTAPC